MVETRYAQSGDVSIAFQVVDGPGRDVDSLVGETAIPLEEILPDAVGRAELRGTVWSARNAGTVTLLKGQRCLVTSVDRLMIFIKAEGVRT